MAKQLSFNEEARSKIKAGIDKVADAVKVTIGPYGRNVVLEKSFGGPTITNDGVSIAKEISLKDSFENMGAEIIKEVANKTNDLAGDGTSTSVILTQAMATEGLKQIEKGVNALSVKKGMDKAYEDVKAEIDKIKKDVNGLEDIKKIAIVSSESDEFGEIIAETINKVGKDGVVTVEESQSIGIESEVVEGLEIDRGYISPYMMTNPERMEAEYKDAKVLLTDKKISSIKDVLPLLEKIAQVGQKDIVIIAEDVDGEALATFVLNKLRGTFNVLAIKAPGFGDNKKEILEDIASTVGGQVVSEDKGMKLSEVDESVLGAAKKVISNKDKTIIVGSGGSVSDRVASLKNQLSSVSSKFDKEKLEERIAKLSGGVAVLKVGAATESEMKYMKLKIEDAVNATKAAVESGVIPGGGSAFVHIANALKNSSREFSDEYESKGYNIVLSALESPLKQIVDNVLGVGEGVSIVRQIQSAGGSSGYDALNRKIVDDMTSAGIIDPAKVATSGLGNAVSAVGIFLTTEGAVADIPEEKKDMGGMPGMNPGMMGM